MFNRTDTVGNQRRHTDRGQHDKALQMHREADDYQGEFGQHRFTTQQHSVEQIGAMKRIEALGAIELLAGDDMVLGCLGNLSQTAAGDLVELLAATPASHTHGGAAPTNAETFNGQSKQTGQLAKTLSPIIE